MKTLLLPLITEITVLCSGFVYSAVVSKKGACDTLKKCVTYTVLRSCGQQKEGPPIAIFIYFLGISIQ